MSHTWIGTCRVQPRWIVLFSSSIRRFTLGVCKIVRQDTLKFLLRGCRWWRERDVLIGSGSRRTSHQSLDSIQYVEGSLVGSTAHSQHERGLTLGIPAKKQNASDYFFNILHYYKQRNIIKKFEKLLMYIEVTHHHIQLKRDSTVVLLGWNMFYTFLGKTKS